MISWIQRTLQLHFKVLFAVLLGIIIVSFVFTIGAPGIGDAQRRGVADRHFFGYNLSRQSDQEKLFGDAGLSANLRVGNMYGGLNPAQVENYAYQRAAALHLADQWGIPTATRTEIEAQLKTMRRFLGPEGQFDAKRYQDFRDSLKTNPKGATEADVARIVSDDVRAEKVQKLLGGPGYVLPADIKTELSRSETSWTIATATTSYTEFKPDLKPTDAELNQFFETAGGRYDVPPRVVVSAVEFPALDYVAKVNVTEAEVRNYYDANPTRFPKPADAKPPALLTPSVAPAADPNADFAAVRPKVESTLKLERAQTLAAKDASDLSLALFEAKATTAEAAEKYVASKNLTARQLPPFTREAPPAELANAMELVNEAFRLSKDRVVSDVVRTGTGSAVLIWKEVQPTRKPLFAEVREKVQADYVENEKRKRFTELGRTAKTEIEARLKAGDNFEKAAAAAGTKTGLKFDVKTFAAFTLRTPPQDANYSILSTLERLKEGEVSDMSVAPDSGVLVYAAGKKVPELNDSDPRFVETRKQIAGYTSRMGASAYLAEMVEKELKKSEPKAE